MKRHPTIEQRCTPFATTTRFDAYRVCRTFDNVAQADLAFDEEAGQAHAERLWPLHASLLFLCFFLSLFHRSLRLKRDYRSVPLQIIQQIDTW
jgi:hypothetical protein